MSKLVRVRRRMFALCLSAGLLSFLSACVPFSGAPVPFIGVRSIDGTLVFTDCSPILANYLEIREREQGSAANAGEKIWVAEAADGARNTRVETVTYGTAPTGMVTTAGPAVISSDSIIELAVIKFKDSTVVNSRYATFDLSQLSESSWLMASGKLVDEPCDR